MTEVRITTLRDLMDLDPTNPDLFILLDSLSSAHSVRWVQNGCQHSIAGRDDGEEYARRKGWLSGTLLVRCHSGVTALSTELREKVEATRAYHPTIGDGCKARNGLREWLFDHADELLAALEGKS